MWMTILKEKRKLLLSHHKRINIGWHEMSKRECKYLNQLNTIGIKTYKTLQRIIIKVKIFPFGTSSFGCTFSKKRSLGG